jgi:hypothetical protein
VSPTSQPTLEAAVQRIVALLFGGGVPPEQQTAAQATQLAVAVAEKPSDRDYEPWLALIERLLFDNRWKVVTDLAGLPAPSNPTDSVLNDVLTQLGDLDAALRRELSATATLLAVTILTTDQSGPVSDPVLDWLLPEMAKRVSWFVQHFVQLDATTQYALLAKFRVTGEDAEGAVAMMMSEAAAGGLIPAYAGAVDPNSFGEWKPKGGQAIPLYIGNAAHEGIADFYEAVNPPLVFKNTTPVQTIINELAEKFHFEAGQLAEAFSLRKPDILHFNLLTPPAWVYEIKPHGSELQAEAQGALYIDILNAIVGEGIQALPGLPGIPGTYGTIPAPSGWFHFESTVPGVITYEYKRAPLKAIRQREEEAKRKQIRAAVEAAGVPAAAAGVVVAFLVILSQYGWRLVLV